MRETDSPTQAPNETVLAPDVPALAMGATHGVWLDGSSGEVEDLGLVDIAARLERSSDVMVCHRRATARRIGLRHNPQTYDLLELFAFVRPARFCLPTPKGLAEALGLPLPATLEQEAETLVRAAAYLLAELRSGKDRDRQAGAVAWLLNRAGWSWGEAVLAALGGGADAPHSRNLTEGLRIWNRLPKWEDRTPEARPSSLPVEPVEARAQLTKLLGTASEKRAQQVEYAELSAQAFLPRDDADEPRLVLAEAGTGVGKTLGYIAPASRWAQKNGSPVWISTFTRNLQRQLDAELDRLYPDAQEKADKVVVRKGRENYLCLLNFQEAVDRLPTRGAADVIALGLMARWAMASRDGDMVGGDFPAWLADLIGYGRAFDLTDKRGECVYAACDHYQRCFVERSIRRARQAEIVVANHALVLVQAALGGGDERYRPTRYVIDEGHHLFDAADSAFSAHLSGMETADLRRWFLGAEGQGRSRAKGLRRRVDDLGAGNEMLYEGLDQALQAARHLPGPGWHQRVSGGGTNGPAETFLALVRKQVYARAGDGGGYSLEAETGPPVPGLLEAAEDLEQALTDLMQPVGRMIAGLGTLLDDEADELETQQRGRIEGLMQSLERRGRAQLQAWRDMLEALATETSEAFVDWMSVERVQGRDYDVGLHRHWIDPTEPFTQAVTEPAHGVLVTSATLRDRISPEDEGWEAADRRSGAHHLSVPAVHAAVASPFDYENQTRVFIVGDVNRNNPDQVAAAYRELMKASGGGALGLFTAITRLRAVHQKILAPLEAAGIPLYAQHVDAMDTGTLIDVFRADENACLLGTDAVRDGVDVPGRSLRLIIFDRVPWPRPDILHKARRQAFGGRAYEEMLTRLKLKQAFGRLVRRAGDHGVFVMLDRQMPSRLLTAFPEGVAVERTGLADACAKLKSFLNGD